MSDVNVPRCWAMNSNRQRCESDAGHRGNHIITIAWDDDEAMEALNGVVVMERVTHPSLSLVSDRVSSAGVPIVPGVPVEEPERTDPCVACGHAGDMHGYDGCTDKGMQMSGEMGNCSCMAFV